VGLLPRLRKTLRRRVHELLKIEKLYLVIVQCRKILPELLRLKRTDHPHRFDVSIAKEPVASPVQGVSEQQRAVGWPQSSLLLLQFPFGSDRNKPDDLDIGIVCLAFGEEDDLRRCFEIGFPLRLALQFALRAHLRPLLFRIHRVRKAVETDLPQ